MQKTEYGSIVHPTCNSMRGELTLLARIISYPQSRATGRSRIKPCPFSRPFSRFHARRNTPPGRRPSKLQQIPLAGPWLTDAFLFASNQASGKPAPGPEACESLPNAFFPSRRRCARASPAWQRGVTCGRAVEACVALRWRPLANEGDQIPPKRPRSRQAASGQEMSAACW